MSQRQLGKYQLQERLERNTIGEAWKAFDTQQSRTVTVTLVTIKQETSSEFIPRFNYEGQALAALHHPNIVQLQEFSVAPNGQEAYIVSDYVQGQSLANYLDATAHTGNIPSPVGIVQLLTPIASALDYAHQRRVVHGALRPAAIILDKSRATPSSLGEPMLTNFGMSQKQDPRLQPLDETSYIAPEVAQGNPVTPYSDLYSLGVILYELCTGTLPFQGETSSDILMQHIHSAPTSPVLINPRIRPALTGIILRSLAREPAARFSSATALVSAVAKSMNINMPESTSQTYPASNPTNPSSWSGINEQDNPTYLNTPPMAISSSQTVLSPPTVVSSNTPVLSPTPVTTSGTPILAGMQQASGPYPVITTNSSLPIAASAPPVSRQTAPPLIPSGIATAPARKRRRRTGFIILTVVLLIVLLGSALLLHLVFPATQQSTLVGQAFFLSSGLINTESNQGITDGLHISLQNIQNPQPGKSYYGWLMSSSDIDVPAFSLGPLPVVHGQITATHYDPGHNNLLANYDRFLITEEDANQQPTNPSLDVNTWRYASTFSTTPDPTDPKHYSVLDHLRHLLSSDPKLTAAGLSGGLDVWLYRNTTKILEAAGSARDSQKACIGSTNDDCASFILRQVARILDYLDGATYVQIENIPPTVQEAGHLLIDPTIARVALLEFDPLRQQPPGYLDHIGGHLQNLKQVPNATAEQRALAIHINQDINNVQGWLTAVHKDASNLIHMSSTQLLQPETLTIFNDLFKQANTAFVGQIDPNTDNVKEGVVQIHYAIQALATFDVTPCTLNNGKSSCA
jgi:eukaryotic-like serine/threonine-protein kinase